MKLITLHTHSSFCGHATDSLSDMVQAAEDAGIAVMAATEHYPLSRSFKEASHASMPAERLEEYKAAVRAEREKHPGMELLVGCELDWLGNDEDRDLKPDDFADFDVVLGSVHFIDRWLLNSSRYLDAWNAADVDALWTAYVDAWCEAATSSMPFTVMAHPDVIKKFGHYPRSLDMGALYGRMAEAAVAGRRAVEVNTSGMFSPCAQYYPAPELLSEFCRAGVPCTVGTDAHCTAHIARHVREAYAYMHAAGYREVAVPLVGGGMRMMPIDEA